MWMMMMRLIRNSRRTSSTAGWGTIRRAYIGSTFFLLRVIILATRTTARRYGSRGIYIYIYINIIVIVGKLVKLWDGGWWRIDVFCDVYVCDVYVCCRSNIPVSDLLSKLISLFGARETWKFDRHRRHVELSTDSN